VSEGHGERAAVTRATALVVFSACCFGSISIFAVLATRAGTPLWTVLMLRYLLGGALLLAVTGVRAARLPWPHALRALVIGGVGQTVIAFLSLSSLRWISAGTLGFLFYTYPAWIAFFAVVRRTEHVDRRRVIALAISFAGIVLMVGSPWAGPIAWQGVVLALASALSYALYVPYLHRLQGGTTPAVASTYVACGAGLACLVAALGTGSFTLHLAPISWAAVTALAVLCTLIAFLAFLRGLATLGPVRTGIIATVEPFWTAVLGALALAQPLTGATIAGGAMIATAVLLLQLPARADVKPAV
jgi:drug/metabolite transporter (DMT)-like permease